MSRIPRRRGAIAALATAVLLALPLPVLAGDGGADPGKGYPRPSGEPVLPGYPGAFFEERVFFVTHAAVTTNLVNPASDGHQLGDVRVNVATPTYDENGELAGRYDAVLITTTIDYPNPGDEVRMVQLNFVFGEAEDAQLAGSADQLIVSGSGYYPAKGSTLAVGTSLIRTITGGSGEFAGATGWADSEHLEDGSWRHTFHVLLPRERAGMPDEPHAHDDATHAGMHGEAGEATAGMPAGSVPLGGGEFLRKQVGASSPAGAPGEELSLWYYEIPAGFQLPTHHHPGDQIAQVVRGVLTFHVVEGTAEVARADGSTETLVAGDVRQLFPGDAVIENPGLVHFGANEGDEMVVLYTATLFTAGSPAAIPVPSPSPAA